jgi:hypothetical protein
MSSKWDFLLVKHSKGDPFVGFLKKSMRIASNFLGLVFILN